MTNTRYPLRIFCSYAHADDKYRRKLEKHLAPLKHDGRVSLWSDRKIVPGTSWRADIEKELEQADLILLLTSSDFIESEFCYSKELQRALERFAQREAMVIPLAIRPVDWKGTPLEGLQALPRDAKPVTLWANQDLAFADIARGVREAVEHFAEWRRLQPLSLGGSQQVHRQVTHESSGTREPAANGQADVQPAPVLKRVFGEIDFRPIGWFQRGLAAVRAVAGIETADGRGIGSGFLVAAGAFDLGRQDESLLVTCSSVNMDAVREGGGRAPFASFERLGIRRSFKEAVWISPPDALDVCFIRLDDAVEVAPLELSVRNPGEMDETTRVYVAGHPFGGPLQFSLWRTAWLDYKTPRCHYRASTGAGSDGSAVFDDDWRVVAIHRSAAVHIPRLHGEGMYAACEGISLLDIRVATSRRHTGMHRRASAPDAE